MDDKLTKRTSLYGFEVREEDNRRTKSLKRYDIKQLWQRSHEIIGLALQGRKQTEIAELLNISTSTVSTTLNSELGKEKLSSLRKSRDEEFIKVSKEVDKLTKRCMNVYEDILESPNASLKLKKETADTLIMDIGGHRAPTKIDSRTMSVSASMEEVEEFKRLGRQAAKEAGFLIQLNNEDKPAPSDINIEHNQSTK